MSTGNDTNCLFRCIHVGVDGGSDPPTATEGLASQSDESVSKAAFGAAVGVLLAVIIGLAVFITLLLIYMFYTKRMHCKINIG